MNFQANLKYATIGLFFALFAIAAAYFEYVTENFRFPLLLVFFCSFSLIVGSLSTAIVALKKEVDELKKTISSLRSR